MATMGRLDTFQQDYERISAYLERVQLYFQANKVADAKQVPVLLSAIGGKTYALLSDLLAPEKPATKTFAQLKDVLIKHFEPKPVVIAERFQFHRRIQMPGETITEFVAELRRLAVHCEFGAYLSESLRDRLVCGLSNEAVQRRLLSEEDLTLTKAIELALSLEAAEKNAATAKVEAVQQAPAPKNITELRSFLGLLNYYGKFMPNLSTLLHPLHQLLKGDHAWHWSQDCEQAFQEAKRKLSAAPILVHYDPKLPMRLAGDASNYGVGAVLSHILPDGTEHPVAFASRTLKPSERNYAQVEKEALSLIYGITKFHKYLYGRPFTLVTNHRPLTTILGPKNGVPSLAAARMQRWSLLLSAYSYNIEFRPTAAHANADGLSRLPLPGETRVDPPSEVSVFNVAQVQALPVTVAQLQQATRNDPILGKILRCIRRGWPEAVPDHLKPYWSRRLELSIEDGCILWGIRVIPPKKLQPTIRDMLHEGHSGIVRMKKMARSYVWWPGIDKELEQLAHDCTPCQKVQKEPAVAPLHPWLWPSKPWARIHLDFAGPFWGVCF